MKLRNKKTGEIIEFDAILPVKDVVGDSVAHLEYGSLAELNEEWEGYEEPKEYWYINEFGTPTKVDFVERETLYDKCRKNFGNYFETEEEAEKAVRKLKAWKLLKDLGFKIEGIRYRNNKSYIEWSISQKVRDDHFTSEAFNDALHLLFGDEE